MSLQEYSIGIISGASGTEFEGKVAMQQSFGRVTDGLAGLFSKCYMSLSMGPDDGTKDYLLQSDNIEFIPQPAWGNIFEGMKHPMGILRAGKRLVDLSDVIFVRGTIPYLPLICLYAIFKAKPIVQWMAGDLLTSLKAAEPESLKRKLRIALAWIDEKWFRFIKKSSYVYMVTSGCVLYEKYKSPRTTLVVSSTIKRDEFYYRDDTCQKEPVRILFVGFVRPGKGLKFLIEALGRLKTSRQFQLAIVGDIQGHLAKQGLVLIKSQIDALGLTDKVNWEGYAPFGPELFSQLRRSDILVLPTLSEGAPHVLVEARAFGLPVVSTNVGGIPSSVKDGVDGILVPPKDSNALAKAIDRVIEDNRFRKELISNGYISAKRFSFEEFIGRLVEVFNIALCKGKI